MLEQFEDAFAARTQAVKHPLAKLLRFHQTGLAQAGDVQRDIPRRHRQTLG